MSRPIQAKSKEQRAERKVDKKKKLVAEEIQLDDLEVSGDTDIKDVKKK